MLRAFETWRSSRPQSTPCCKDGILSPSAKGLRTDASRRDGSIARLITSPSYHRTVDARPCDTSIDSAAQTRSSNRAARTDARPRPGGWPAASTKAKAASWQRPLSLKKADEKCAVAHRVYYGPVYLRRQTAPYM